MKGMTIAMPNKINETCLSPKVKSDLSFIKGKKINIKPIDIANLDLDPKVPEKTNPIKKAKIKKNIVIFL